MHSTEAACLLLAVWLPLGGAWTAGPSASQGPQAAPPSPISWLSVCPAPPPGARRVVEQVSLTGVSRFVAVTTARPDDVACAVTRVRAPIEAVRWLGAVTAETADRLGKGVILQGLDETPAPRVSEIIPTDEGTANLAPPAAESEAPAPSTRQATPARSVWAWQPDLWRERANDTFGRLERWEGRVVYVTVPVDDRGEVGDPAQLAAFIEDARGRHVEVWVVDGEPRSVLPYERGRLVGRVRAYAAFNARQPSTRRLAGLQLDVEPYLVSLAGEGAEALHQAYVETLAAVRAAAGMTLEVAVPFWWIDRRVPDGTFASALARVVDSVAVMDYRTDPALVERFALPWLRWGVTHGRGVRIALEAGPIPDEVRVHFRPDERGDLWHVRVGSQDVLLLFDREVADLPGRAFAYSHVSQFRGDTLSFQGRADELRALLPSLERTFSAWPSFLGMALHEVP